jgi:hypothetical protein
MMVRRDLPSGDDEFISTPSAMWPQILPVAAIGLAAWPDLVAKLEEYLGERLLLHAAVTSGSLSMVILILDLHELFRWMIL